MKGKATGLFLWDTPVHVRIGHGFAETIDGPLEALTYLATRWPAARGPRYDEAQNVCRSALEGYGSIDRAREAFIAAAGEASVLE